MNKTYQHKGTASSIEMNEQHMRYIPPKIRKMLYRIGILNTL